MTLQIIMSLVHILDPQAKHLGHGSLLCYLENSPHPPFPGEIISAWTSLPAVGEVVSDLP